MFKKTVSKIQTPPTPETIASHKRRDTLVKVLLLVLAIGGMATSVYYFKQYNLIKNNPDIVAQKESDRVISALGKMMELPIDEAPVMATITDKEKLKDQLFFSKTENGDIVLAYNKAMQAILYRPSSNKIIAVAPMVPAAEQEGASEAPQSQLKIAYYNGTETVGLSGQLEKKVASTYPNYQTGVINNASRKDFKETLIVDISGVHLKEANDLATLLGAKVAPFPEGEVRPDADILVIAGK